MSTVSATDSTSSAQTSSSSSSFEDQLNIAQSSKIISDYLKQNGKSAINSNELSQLASNASGDVPDEVSAAAGYMTSHSDVFTAIETHDVAGADGLSGTWNFDWAAEGGLEGTSTEAMAEMKDVFDRAIESSAQITKLTTEKKTGLDATKQRPQN